jgi:hypothetical protein
MTSKFLMVPCKKQNAFAPNSCAAGKSTAYILFENVLERTDKPSPGHLASYRPQLGKRLIS